MPETRQPTNEEIMQAFRDWCEGNGIDTLMLHFAPGNRVSIASLPPSYVRSPEGDEPISVWGIGDDVREATIDFIRKTGYPWTWKPPEDTPPGGLPVTDG